MKTNIIKFLMLFIFITAFTSCEEDVVVYDTENGEAFAGFESSSPENIIFNPVAETVNTVTIGVSTVSSSDRTVNVSVDESSTLDPSFYTIETLNPVIPAGELTTQVVVTTPATTTFPAEGSELILNLDSVEGTDIPSFSTTTQNLGFSVACPTVEYSEITGIYDIVVDPFGSYVGDGQFEIVAGPGENEFTMVNFFGHPEDYDVVFSVNPETGRATVARQDAWHCDNFGCAYGVGRIQGSGQVLTCIEQIDFSFTHTVDAGSFGTYPLRVRKAGPDSGEENGSEEE